MTATPNGGGYWFVAADGGIFSYGDAQFYGARGGQNGTAPVIGMAAMPDGGGYWVATSDGVAGMYGDAPALASNVVGVGSNSVIGIALDGGPDPAGHNWHSGHTVRLCGRDSSRPTVGGSLTIPCHPSSVLMSAGLSALRSHKRPPSGRVNG